MKLFKTKKAARNVTPESVKSYIMHHNVKTKTRINSANVLMLIVYYPGGIIKEYEFNKIGEIAACIN